ncbi:hypothetical protein MOTC310_26285 [Methylobacterium oryzae]|uniref:Uncharacterized protein n=1 Tax=Methylobacterium oryzae TaxID=334852 RepID=A0ABU7TVE9_9HYPH
MFLSIPRSGLEISDPLAGGLGGKRGGSIVLHFEEFGHQADWPSNMGFHAQIEVTSPGLSGLRATALKVCGLGGMSMDLGISESEEGTCATGVERLSPAIQGGILL